jgi:hypothetical protein
MLCAILLLAWVVIQRGKNTIIIYGYPTDGMSLSVVDTDNGKLVGEVFPINNGEVDLGWGYSLKNNRLLFRIIDNSIPIHECDLMINPSGRSEIFLSTASN